MLKFTKYRRNKKLSARIEWFFAPDVKKRVAEVAGRAKVNWIETSRIYCFRSTGSKTRARARIWGLSRIWQMALKTKPAYIVEVISEKFDNLSTREQDEVLLHELAHIPGNFSGSLLPHIRRGKRNFHDRVEKLIAQYLRKEKSI